MAKKRNIIVGQSGGPTSVINSSLAGVYKNAIERGFDKVYGMLHGIQGHEEPDVEEELGDVLWYVAMIAKLIGSDLETVMFRNIEKLRERYPDGFEVERSVNRK